MRITTATIFVTMLIIALTSALCFGAFRLGYETSTAVSAQRENARLLELIGIVDQAKGRELASCFASGRQDCQAVILPVEVK